MESSCFRILEEILQIQAVAFDEGFQLFGQKPAGTAERSGILHLRENLQLGKTAFDLIHGLVIGQTRNDGAAFVPVLMGF